MLLYVIENAGKTTVKVGVASKPDFRLRGYAKTNGPLHIAATFPCNSKDIRALDRWFKRALAPYRVHGGGWYALSANAALQILATSDLKPPRKQKQNWLDRYLDWRAS